MIGGGFYALLGKIVGSAGIFTPLSLVLAGTVALVSAFSFAELSRRYPVSAGEVQYVDAAFGITRLSQLVGIMVVVNNWMELSCSGQLFSPFMPSSASRTW